MENRNYTSKEVRSILSDSTEITFLDIAAYSDGCVARVEAETFGLKDGKIQEGPTSRLSIVHKDEKRRHKKTYEKAGVTKEAVSEGLPTEEFCNAAARYFADHPGVIVSPGESLEILHRMISSIGNEYLDIHAMALYCREPYRAGGLKVMESLFVNCMRVYARLDRAELNKIQCSLKKACYWEQEVRSKRNWVYRKRYLFFSTSAGTVYYDIENGLWDMSAKERSRTGLAIETFDVDDLKKQALQKYRVRDLSELEMRLRADMKPGFSCA